MATTVAQQAQNMTNHTIQLGTRVQGNRIFIDGNGGATLPKGSGAHRFNFILNDTTTFNVEFDTLDTEDDTTCPPSSGENSDQIVGVVINSKDAHFTDNNSRPVNVCYQWNFTCNDSSKTVEPFDPIIINGGL